MAIRVRVSCSSRVNTQEKFTLENVVGVNGFVPEYNIDDIFNLFLRHLLG
ncbi:hypothetical protein LguiB_020208 [Lonicera macranthoides]